MQCCIENQYDLICRFKEVQRSWLTLAKSINPQELLSTPDQIRLSHFEAYNQRWQQKMLHFTFVLQGNIKHHDDTSYRIVTVIIFCDVSWRERDAKTLLQVAENVKDLYFKMSSSVTSFLQAESSYSCQTLLRLEAPSGRGAIPHTLWERSHLMSRLVSGGARKQCKIIY